MLVSIFNTTDRSGGAGIAAFRLAQALQLHGVEAPVFCLHRRFNDRGTFRYRLRTTEISRSLQTQRDALAQVQKRFVAGNRTSVSRTIFSEPWASGMLVGDNPLVADSRVLHLHWVNHFLDLHSLQELALVGRPIVWTLHDEWLFTAGCHYTSGCDAFLTRCTDCPQLLQDPYALVDRWFEQKAGLLAELDLTVVTPSEWLAERARQSTLLKGKPVTVLRNPFDGNTFRPMSADRRTECRRRHGFDEQAIVLGFGAQSVTDVRKGFGLLLQALETLVADGELMQGRRIGLLVFGSRSEQLDSLRDRMTISYLGELSEETAIAEVLGSLDGFIVPSREENYPNVIIEALLCRTPVIAFGCGGIPEQIEDGVNGMLVRPVGDVAALGDALRRFCGDEPLRQRLGRFDRDAIAKRHSFASIAEQTLALYRSLAPDFDKPVDRGVLAFLAEQRNKKGPARDFLGVPSYRVVGSQTSACVAVADQADAILAERDTQAHAARDRQYLGFFGEPHRFGTSGTSHRFLNFGWSTPESQGTWSCEKFAGIAFAVPPGTRSIRLGLVGFCKGNSQVMLLQIGAEEVARIKLTASRARHEAHIALPEHAQAGGLMQLRLQFPHAQRESHSTRLLGLFLCEMSAEITLQP
jgi:glycosyltransferase involved in cell wall biosynthesis